MASRRASGDVLVRHTHETGRRPRLEGAHGATRPRFVFQRHGAVRAATCRGRAPSGGSYTRRAGESRRRRHRTGGTVPKSYVRLTQPLVRDTKGGELRPATWDEALDRTAAGLRAALDRPRPGGARGPAR